MPAMRSGDFDTSVTGSWSCGERRARRERERRVRRERIPRRATEQQRTPVQEILRCSVPLRGNRSLRTLCSPYTRLSGPWRIEIVFEAERRQDLAGHEVGEIVEGLRLLVERRH